MPINWSAEEPDPAKRMLLNARGTANSRPTSKERGFSGAKPVRDESALKKWARKRGAALDWIPEEDRDPESPRPVPHKSVLEEYWAARAAAPDFTPRDWNPESPRPTPAERGLAGATPDRDQLPKRGAKTERGRSLGQGVDPARDLDWSGLRRRLEKGIPDKANDILRALSDPGNGRTADAFVGWALGQKGHPYDQKTAAAPSDLTPLAFDCSSLVRWSAARQGIHLPRTCDQQIATMRSANAIIPVEQAIRTRGALLFHSGHVAISLGNGRTIEAMGKKWGVREGGTVVHNKDGTQSPRFTEGALIPGLRY